MACDSEEYIEFLNGPADGLEIPLSVAVQDSKIVIVMHVKLDSLSSARYIYSERDSKYVYVDYVDIYNINTGKVINFKDWIV